MATEELVFGHHEYIVTTIEVVGGGHTVTVVHRDFQGGAVEETRHDSNSVHETESDALEYGKAVATEMAARQVD